MSCFSELGSFEEDRSLKLEKGVTEKKCCSCQTFVIMQSCSELLILGLGFGNLRGPLSEKAFKYPVFFLNPAQVRLGFRIFSKLFRGFRVWKFRQGLPSMGFSR